LVPYLNVISEDEIISAGNPDLKATYAYNFDFMAENTLNLWEFFPEVIKT
jgi:hypothetical protein